MIFFELLQPNMLHMSECRNVGQRLWRAGKYPHTHTHTHTLRAKHLCLKVLCLSVYPEQLDRMQAGSLYIQTERHEIGLVLCYNYISCLTQLWNFCLYLRT